MCESKTSVIISAGTELTEGIIQDTHVRFLSSELVSLGFTVLRGVQIPDSVPLFRAELARAARDACLVIITGGLGPTTDDLTREMVAEAAGVPLEFHPEAWEALLARFAGRSVSDTNRKQALAPKGFTLMPNPNGTAPGFHGTVGDALVVSLPGPPSELRPMFAQSVLPLLRERFGGFSEADILWGTALMVPESSLEEALQRVQPARAFRGARGWRRTGSGSACAAARARSARRSSRHLTQRVGPVRIRAGRDAARAPPHGGAPRARRPVGGGGILHGRAYRQVHDGPRRELPRLLGWVRHLLQRFQDRLWSGWMRRLLREQGAVSEQAVRAMAQGALAASGVELAIAVSGVAGPDGGTPEKPVGTVWMAAALKGRPRRCAPVHLQRCARHDQAQERGGRDASRRGAASRPGVP